MIPLCWKTKRENKGVSSLEKPVSKEKKIKITEISVSEAAYLPL